MSWQRTPPNPNPSTRATTAPQVSVLFGLLLVLCSGILMALRAWVMHDGGMPDGGVGRARREEPAPASAGPGAVDNGRAATAAKDGNTLC